MSGVLQICNLLRSIEMQILEETPGYQTKGEFYYILDRYDSLLEFLVVSLLRLFFSIPAMSVFTCLVVQ